MYLPGIVGLVIFLSDVPPCSINLASCGHSHCEEIMFCSSSFLLFFCVNVHIELFKAVSDWLV